VARLGNISGKEAVKVFQKAGWRIAGPAIYAAMLAVGL
jgi:hypothetical protein